jgi:hypothetical protein
MSIQSGPRILRLILASALLLLISQLAISQQAESQPAVEDPAATSDLRLEFVPFQGVVVATVAGSTGVSSIEIINRGSEPLEITGAEHSNERFTVLVETIETGERYRLTVTFDAQDQEGKAAEFLYLLTNRGRVAIPVHTEVIPSVYVFPRSVYLGKFDLTDIRGNSETARTMAQILMVYRKNTTDFQIDVSSDVTFLKIESVQGPLGDRWENTIWLDPDSVVPGEINGTIVIETNDSEVPRLEVPVTGTLHDR